MDKRYKVKHYKSRIYNPIRGKIIKAVLAVSAMALLFTLGWFAYEPLMDRINSANKEIIENNPISVPEQEKAPEEPLVDFIDKETLAVTVPTEKLYSATDYYNFLSSLDGEVTAVVLDMKTSDGTVTYNSKQVSVQEYGTAAENAVDMESRINTARNMGFDVVARIYAFQDSTAPYKAYDMAIRYESEEGVLWLDDSVDNGGKPWLNPYSDTAQKYLLDIVCDAVDFGVDAIILDGVRFPDANGMEYAYFGVTAETVSRGEILSQFVQRIYSTTVTSETDILIAYDGFTVISGEDDIYGASPAAFIGDGLSPVIDLTAFVGERVNDDIYYPDMPEDVTELAGDIYEALGYATDKKVFPTLVCSGLEKQQLETIKTVFSEKGASGYIIIYDEVFFGDAPEEENTGETENDPENSSQPEEETSSYTPSQSSSSYIENEPESIPESSESSSDTDTSYSGESSESSSNAWNGSGPITIGGD